MLNTIADKLLLVVPADRFTALRRPAVDGTVYEAVRTDEFDSPKEIPLLFENDSVPEVWVCVPAMMPLIPVCAPAIFAPEMVSDIPPAPVDPDNVMLLPPASTSWLDTVPLEPEVFPPDKPAENA